MTERDGSGAGGLRSSAADGDFTRAVEHRALAVKKVYAVEASSGARLATARELVHTSPCFVGVRRLANDEDAAAAGTGGRWGNSSGGGGRRGGPGRAPRQMLEAAPVSDAYGAGAHRRGVGPDRRSSTSPRSACSATRGVVVSQVAPGARQRPRGTAVRGPEARRDEGRDQLGPVSGRVARKPRSTRPNRHGRPGRAPGQSSPLRHAIQLRAGERGVGDAAAGLLRAGEPGLVEAPREGREAARRSGPPPGRGGPRRPTSRPAQGSRSRRRRSSRPWIPAGRRPDGPGARAARGPGDDQAARRGRGPARPRRAATRSGRRGSRRICRTAEPSSTRSRSRGTRRPRRRSSTTGRRTR